MMKRLLLLLALTPLFISCSEKKAKKLVLWTDCIEFVSYTELYNSLQDKVKIIALYKDAPAFPPSKGEQKPDIIAGTFLQNGMEKKHFSKLNSLFGKHTFLREDFYPALLEYGKLNKKQFLLPVNFNLPALVFNAHDYNHEQNQDFSFEAIKEKSKKFNVQNKNGTYSEMGFGLHWNTDFLYLVFKTAGINYTIKNGSFEYNEYAFNNTLNTINQWSNQINGGAKTEQDFAFKYLYMPIYDQLQNGRNLFSYATSKQIMTFSEDQHENIDFRWICNNKKIQIEDDAVMMGIYSKSKNKAAAKNFLVWFFNEENQEKMLERQTAIKLRVGSFGIAGGFSSIQNVNKNLFPIFYKHLCVHLPESDSLATPQIFPSEWNEIKKQVLFPYIDTISENSDAKVKSLTERYKDYISTKESIQH